MKILFEILSMCDWISPIYETVKDIDHMLIDGSKTYNLTINKNQMRDAEKELKNCGFGVISSSCTAFKRYGFFTMLYEDVNEAYHILARKGFDVDL